MRHSGENYQLATAMDPKSREELLTHHLGGNHGDEEASGDDSPPPGGCRNRAAEALDWTFEVTVPLCGFRGK